MFLGYLPCRKFVVARLEYANRRRVNLCIPMQVAQRFSSNEELLCLCLKPRMRSAQFLADASAAPVILQRQCIARLPLTRAEGCRQPGELAIQPQTGVAGCLGLGTWRRWGRLQPWQKHVTAWLKIATAFPFAESFRVTPLAMSERCGLQRFRRTCNWLCRCATPRGCIPQTRHDPSHAGDKAIIAPSICCGCGKHTKQDTRHFIPAE
jgi:hypothetical protein